MKINLLFVLLFVVLQTQAQDFTAGPFQNFDLSLPVVADFDGDSTVDVLGIQFGSNANTLVLQINKGIVPIGFTPKNLNLDLNAAYGQPDAADMDGDTDIDVAIAEGTDYHLFILQNDGNANFTLDSLGVSGSNRLKIVDIDNDTDMDIVGINTDNSSLNIYVNDGSQNFSITNITINSSNLALLDVEDMDNDNDLDIVLGFDQFSGKQIALYKNNGANSFEEIIVIASGFSSIEGLVIDDINSDGKKDILAIRNFNCDAFINQGGLAFERKTLATAPNLVRSVRTGDYNGDGKTDIMLGTNSEGISWYKNLSNTTLTFASQYVGGVSPAFSIINGDLDNDGDEDIVVSNGEFWWYRNNIVQEPVSSTLNFSEREINIFPNPFNDVIQINNLGQDAYLISMVDIHGKIVYSSKVSSNFIDLSSLRDGVYFLSLTNTTTHQTLSTLIGKAK